MFFKWLPTIAFAAFDVLRKPEWPETAAKVKIPRAGWIIAAMLAAALAYLAFVMTRDPLQGPR
jgi:hypothetical protein